MSTATPTAATAPTFEDVQSHRPYLIRYARAQLRNENQSEEVVQECLLAALEGLQGFSGRSTLRTWLTSILRFKIIDLQRRVTFERSVVVTADDEVRAGEDFFDCLFDSTGHRVTPTAPWRNPEEALEQKHFWEAFERCLDKLPATTGRVFFRRDVLGDDTESICKEETISQSNCWVMLHRARLALRECLAENWFLREG